MEERFFIGIGGSIQSIQIIRKHCTVTFMNLEIPDDATWSNLTLDLKTPSHPAYRQFFQRVVFWYFNILRRESELAFCFICIAWVFLSCWELEKTKSVGSPELPAQLVTVIPACCPLLCSCRGFVPYFVIIFIPSTNTMSGGDLCSHHAFKVDSCCWLERM